MNGKQKGFTLIELLVVVLIIGVLAAIALPQYQKAVLKSRYTTLMPIAKGIAEGNEAYFMEHGTYAEDPTELPIKGQESYPDGTELRVVDDTDKDISYVIATRPQLMPNNKYIVFQKHSGKFSNVTLCEATSDPLATWLCKDALKGQVVEGKSLSGEGWTGYALSGNTTGSSFSSALEQVAEGIKAQNSNYAIASIDEENGKVTFCDTSVATVTNGQCQPTGERAFDGALVPYEITYDEDGETVLSKKECIAYLANTGCQWVIIHNNNGQEYTTKELSCYSGGYITDNGQCSGLARVNDKRFDSHDSLISARICFGSATSQCAAYTSGVENIWEYDDNNHVVSYHLEQNCYEYSGNTCTSAINRQARKALYNGETYNGYTAIDTDLEGYAWQETYDANGQQIPGSYADCTNGVDWENAVCL